MATPSAIQELVNEKLATFERLQPEFEACFHFVQLVHGQQRFNKFPLVNAVRYLHSLWVCECKDRLLSIYRNIERYEGRYCLELLLRWQEGETADVVDFLNRKLDMLPFADLTRQISEALKSHKDDGLARRLIDGRGVLLNRGMNLMQALDGIFSLPEEKLISEVQLACAQYGHHPSQIERQLKEIDSQLYAYLPSRILAQRNIEVMNKMGVRVMSKPSDQPGERSWRVLEPTVPPGPFAEYVVEGYVELTSPNHNNITGLRFVDFPERSDTGTM
ncbi:MAG: hypothetical protein E6I32_11235 [Chloroflexi bacterium]|nr:MAG: hypothetical protein E6I32_11235 [Chloroflexota bacterium]